MRIPRVRRLEEERDVLRAERDSMRLKVRATSAKMGVLEEQVRVLVGERDRYAEQVKAQVAEHGRLSEQLRAALAASGAAAAERDKLKADHDALIVQQEDAVSKRDQLVHEPGRARQGAAASLSPAISSPGPAKEKASGQGR